MVARLREAVPGLHFAVEYVPGFGHEPGYRHGWAIGVRDVRVGPAEAILDRPAAKLLARHPEMARDELLAVAVEVLGAEAVVTSSSQQALVEIAAPGVTKASALEGLAASAGVSAGEVIAFGDMPNDLPMLAWAGRSVAVANAHPVVLAAVDEVTASNDEDGVAVVVEHLLAGLPAPFPARSARSRPVPLSICADLPECRRLSPRSRPAGGSARAVPGVEQACAGGSDRRLGAAGRRGGGGGRDAAGRAGHRRRPRLGSGGPARRAVPGRRG